MHATKGTRKEERERVPFNGRRKKEVGEEWEVVREVKKGHEDGVERGGVKEERGVGEGGERRDGEKRRRDGEERERREGREGRRE